MFLSSALRIAPRDKLPRVGAVTRAAADVSPRIATGGYRASLDQLMNGLTRWAPRMTSSDIARQLSRWLHDSEVQWVVDQVPGGGDRIIEQALEEYLTFAPCVASNASDPVSVMRIVLLQQIDVAWWSRSPSFADDIAINTSLDLLDLRQMRATGQVRFGFGIGSDRLLRRARDFAVQRLWPDHEPRGPGLSCRLARPELIAVLNELADRLGLAAPEGTPRLWVNSIVRSVVHQRRLRTLGFTALLPSAHCQGWAADVELAWFERFGARDALRSVLLEYSDSGVLNVIDEGRAWHVCLAPHAVARYRMSGR
jgi:hypothetical protein